MVLSGGDGNFERLGLVEGSWITGDVLEGMLALLLLPFQLFPSRHEVIRSPLPYAATMNCAFTIPSNRAKKPWSETPEPIK